MTAFGDWLRETRLARGLRQIDVAALLGWDDRQVSHYERGISVPTEHTRRKIIATLGVDPATAPRDPVRPQCGAIPSGLRRKYALFPGPRRLRELGPLAVPAHGPAVSDIKPCPECGQAMTGWRPIMDGYLCAGTEEVCLFCRQERWMVGRKEAESVKYALCPTPRRLSYLAAHRELRRRLTGESIPAPPAPVVQQPIDLWLFDEQETRGGAIRQRLAAINLERRRMDIQERLGA
jgi:transcriptional regulator with XRE-family HTH domain